MLFCYSCVCGWMPFAMQSCACLLAPSCFCDFVRSAQTEGSLLTKSLAVHYSLLILCLLFCLLYLLNFVFVAPLCLIHSSLRLLLNQGLGLVRLSLLLMDFSLLTVDSWHCSNSVRPALNSLLDIGWRFFLVTDVEESYNDCDVVYHTLFSLPTLD